MDLEMDKEGLPLGFGFALAQNPDAMKNFSSLPKSKQSEILQKVHAVSSKDEMQSLVDDLSTQD